MDYGYGFSVYVIKLFLFNESISRPSVSAFQLKRRGAPLGRRRCRDLGLAAGRGVVLPRTIDLRTDRYEDREAGERPTIGRVVRFHDPNFDVR